MDRIELNRVFFRDKILLDCKFFGGITNFHSENKEE